jgi:hypothetical protein
MQAVQSGPVPALYLPVQLRITTVQGKAAHMSVITTWHKARKPRPCSYCPATIHPGQRYLRCAITPHDNSTGNEEWMQEAACHACAIRSVGGMAAHHRYSQELTVSSGPPGVVY